MDDSFSLISVISWVLSWLVIVALVLFVPRNRKPSSAIAWLLVIFFLPIIGLFLFAVIGSPKLSNRRREQQREIDKQLESHYAESKGTIKESRYADTAKLIQNLGGLPVSNARDVTILPDYDEAIENITQEILKAKDTVYIEYFILAKDKTTQPLFDALADAVQRGVEVKVLFDAFGSKGYPNFKEMKQFMDENYINYRAMLPIRLQPRHYNRPDLRNHRKVVTIDGEIGYIGSQNMVDRAYHRKDDIYYDELVAKVSGECVEQFDVVFLSDWYFETDDLLIDKKSLKDSGKKGIPIQLLPSGSTYHTENNAILFTELIHKAEKEIVITNPYFVPNEAIYNAITSAVYRGVKVKLVNSEAMDQWMVGHAMRSFYRQLLEAGVEIYLFKAPKLLHSKHITIDDNLAMIGSSNMDIRSFELNLECVMVVYDKKVTAELKKIEKQNISDSRKLSLKDWQKRGFWKELGDSVARLTAALQ